YKLENLLALGAAGLIFLTAYELAREAVMALLSQEPPPPVHNLPLTLVGLGLLTVLTLVWVYYEQSVARRTNSPALEADAGHVFTDVLSLAALFAVLVGALFGLRLDAWATLLIVVLVALTGWRLAVAALRVLLDASVEREVLNAVEAALAEHPHVTKVEAVRGRNSGSYRFIEAVVQLDVHDFDEAEKISRELEGRVREAAPFVDDFMLHCRPRQKTHEVYALPVEEDYMKVCEHFGEAPGFLLVRVKLPEKVVEDVAYLPNPYGEVEHGKGIQVAEMLIAHGAEVILTPSSLEGRGSFYALREAHRQVHVTGAHRTTDALAEHGVRLSREQLRAPRLLRPDQPPPEVEAGGPAGPGTSATVPREEETDQAASA
ncbi:MAG: cation diffusion facilitator family transporter, partial [Armatimonadetes bacterium]|nr:cation diffusion facilitator family transporter [Armatimonadota bacterium]